SPEIRRLVLASIFAAADDGVNHRHCGLQVEPEGHGSIGPRRNFLPQTRQIVHSFPWAPDVLLPRPRRPGSGLWWIALEDIGDGFAQACFALRHRLSRL